MHSLHMHLPLRGGWLALALVLALGACSGLSGDPRPDANAPDAQAQAEQRARQELSALSALGAAELQRRSAAALQAQRLHSPAGDNAFEYYLALRAVHPAPDAATESALIDLMPYTVIGAEDALARQDYAEAERLRALIAAADPIAPALPRIARLIAEGRAAVASPDPAVRKDASSGTSVAAAALTPSAPRPAQQVASATAAPAPPQASPRPATQANAPSLQPTVPAAVAASPNVAEPAAGPTDAASPPAPAAGTALVPLRAPQPGRPSSRDNEGAEIVASYTVNPDGSVSNIAVNSIGKRQLAFERNVEMALRRWRYQPIASARTVTQRFEFAAGQ